MGGGGKGSPLAPRRPDEPPFTVVPKEARMERSRLGQEVRMGTR